MNPYLFPSLPTGAKLLCNLISRVPEELLDEPTHPGRFTPREVAAHMADWEPILRERMQRTVAEPGCQTVGIDEGQRAIEQGYSSKDLALELSKYLGERQATIEWLRTLPQAAWQAVSIHNERGPMSLSDQANLLLGHDLYHIDQVYEVVCGLK